VKLEVKVVPRSSKREVTRESDGSLRVRVTSPPEKGKANEEVLELLAGFFRVKKSDVAIVAGLKSRKKVVEVRVA
jgi:hypothetical protein